jgi:hypothetical protein
MCEEGMGLHEENDSVFVLVYFSWYTKIYIYIYIYMYIYIYIASTL